MMRKNKLAFMAISALLMLTLLLSACGGGGASDGDVLSGTWEGKDDNGTEVTMKFDGKGGLKFSSQYSSEEPGTYTIQGDQVDIKSESWDNARSYTFVMEDESLTLTRPEDAYYVNFDLTKK